VKATACLQLSPQASHNSSLCGPERGDSPYRGAEQAIPLEIIMNAFDFPPEFRTMHIATNGTTIYVRSGGTGPAVVLLHGYGETGDMRVTCFRAPRVASLAPPRAVAARTVFFARKDPRIRLLHY
jgi:hypothetical protein